MNSHKKDVLRQRYDNCKCERKLHCKISKQIVLDNIVKRRYDEGEIQMMEYALPAFLTAGGAAVTHRAMNTLNKADEALDTLRERAELVAQTIQTSIDALKTSLEDKMTTTVDCFTFIKDLITSLLNVFMAQRKYLVYSVILNFATTVARFLNTDLMKYAREFFETFLELISFSKPDETEIQFLPEVVEHALTREDGTIVKLLLFGLVTVYHVCILGTSPGKTDLESLTNRFGNLARSTNNIKGLYASLDGVAKEAQDYMKNLLNIKTPTEADKLLDGYEKWLQDVEDVSNRFEELTAADRILRDKDFVLKVESLYKQSMEFARDLAAIKILSKEIMFTFLQHQKVLNVIYKQIDTTGVFGDKPRTKPIVIWLFGESQIGKSGMTWPLSIDLNSQLVTSLEEAKDFSKHIYYRNVEQEFWDNYKQQNIVVYDDFAQTKDSETAPNQEFMEIIRSVNIAPYPLHMADLVDKRKTKFTSKVLLLTSNKKDLKIDSLNYPDAVLARINLCGRVYLKPEFEKDGYSETTQRTVKRLDIEKAQADSNAAINTNVYLIDIVNAESNETLETGLSYTQFCMKAKALLRQEMESSLLLTQYLSDYAAASFAANTTEIQIQTEPDNRTYLQRIQEGISRAFSKHDKAWETAQRQSEPTPSTSATVLEEDLANNYSIIPIGEFEQCSMESMLYDAYAACADNSNYNFRLLLLDIENRIRTINLAVNPLIITWDFFNTMIRFEIYNLQQDQTHPFKVTRIAFAKYYAKEKIYIVTKTVRELWSKTKENFKTCYKYSPYLTIASMVALCLPLVRMIFQFWPSSFKFEKRGKLTYTCTGRVDLPHIDLNDDIDILIDYIFETRLSVVALSFHFEFTDTLIEVMESIILEEIPWQVLIIIDKPGSLISPAEQNIVNSTISKFLSTTTSHSVPMPVLIKNTLTGAIVVEQPFSKPIDTDIEMDTTRMLKHTAYLEAFENLDIKSAKDNSRLIVELAQSGDSVTAKPKRRHYLEIMKQRCKTIELAQSGDSVTAKPKRTVHIESQEEKDKAQWIDTLARTVIKRVEISKAEQKAQLEDHVEATISEDVCGIYKEDHKPKEKVSIDLHQSGDSVTVKPKRVTHIETGDVVDTKLRRRTELTREAISKVAQDTLLEIATTSELQIQDDVSCHQLISNKILKNLYACEMYKKGKDDVLINCGKINILFVRGALAITPRHINYALVSCDIVRLTNSLGNVYEMDKENIELHFMQNALGQSIECCMLNFKTYVPHHSDIVKHFTNAQSMSMYTNMRTILPSLRQHGDKYLPYFYVGLESEAVDIEYQIVDTNDPNLTCVIRRGMQYMAPTQRGDCGTPLLVDNTQITHKILGLHVVGKHNNKCLAETITQNDLRRAFTHFPAKAQIQFHDEMVPGIKLIDIPLEVETLISEEKVLSMVPCEKFMPIGNNSLPIFTPKKTNIFESMIHGELEPILTKPAYLRPIRLEDGTYFDIKQQMLKKAAMYTPYIPESYVEEAVNYTKFKLLNNINTKNKRILSIEESVSGIPGDEYLGPINRITSPGFPWILERTQGKGKQQWMGDGEEYVIAGDLRAAVIEREDLARKGIRKPCVWTDTLKDERRPIEKVNVGKTRVFAAGPQDFTILYRQYFLGFIAHIMENRITNEQSLGTNVYGPDWTQTARYLQQVGNKVIAGDFQTFDGTLNSCILDRFVDVVNEFYDDGPENSLIRQVLFREVLNSIHLFPEWNMFYMWTHSQTSGSPSTTPVNSFYNSVVMRIAYKIAAKNAKISVRMADFDNTVRIVSYGDDNCLNISDTIISWFNQHTITKALTEVGMIYTDESKSGGDAPAFRELHEIAYLKRQFIFDPITQTFLAPLDIGVVLEMPNWIRGNIDPIEATRQNCIAAISELAWHKKEIFQKFLPKITNAFTKKTRKTLAYDTYEFYHTDRMLKYFISSEHTLPSVTQSKYNRNKTEDKASEENRVVYLGLGYSEGSPF